MLEYAESDAYSFEIEPKIKEELKTEGLTFPKKKKEDLYDDELTYYSLFLFNNHPNLKSIVSIYSESNKYLNSIQRKIINAMDNVYTSIFEITKVDSKNGYVYIKDICSDKEYTIIDIGLSLNSKVIDNAYIYSRIMTLIIFLLIHVLSQYIKMKKILEE